VNMDLENELNIKSYLSYLLGNLNPDEQQRLEERLMTDSDAFEELQRIEDELIDDYLEGGLTDRDKERFENFFLAAPERRQKLSFAKSLKRYVAAHRPKKNYRAFWSATGQALWPARSPFLKWALAASIMFVVAGGSWSALQISKLQTALERDQTNLSESQRQLRIFQSNNSQLAALLANEQAQITQLKQEMADLKRAPKPGSPLLPGQIQPILALSLAPGRSRSSGGIQEIIIPSGERLVKLDLKMEPMKYPQYQATLQRIGGEKIRAQTESSIEGQFPGLYISSELLTPGDYELRLSGITSTGEIEEIDDYYFRATLR
jgi:hypothetical protein